MPHRPLSSTKVPRQPSRIHNQRPRAQARACAPDFLPGCLLLFFYGDLFLLNLFFLLTIIIPKHKHPTSPANSPTEPST
jgi:hypothetical protein